jgi:predicted tellurium resistance membrane protein TerC
VMGLTAPLVNFADLFNITNETVVPYLILSGRDLILFIGGLFLLYKSTTEIHHKVEGHIEATGAKAKVVTFSSVIIQIMILDLVFSLDSVITAVGMVDQIGVMIASVIVAVGIMLVSAEAISRFVNDHPTVKMLALAFLLLIGVSLTAEAFDQHIPKGYIYFAMAFSVLVEFLNIKAMKKAQKSADLHIVKDKDITKN